MISRELLSILACPLCRVEVVLSDDRIVCTRCGRRYPIREGIPVMLLDEAEVPEGADDPDGSEGAEVPGGIGDTELAESVERPAGEG